MTISFEAFFEAVWGHEPYPWQTELSRRVRAEGWPQIIDVPTGCGKTAVLDIALHHFVTDARGIAPRRMILVVDRRVIVDQAGIRARTLRDALHDPGSRTSKHVETLSHFREALKGKIGGSVHRLLHTSVLRGGTIRTDAWAHYPHVPVIAASTVDQVGSRLFFRGYGVSRRMQALHAGLVGCDTLLLLDEVHLARPFADVLEQLAEVRASRERAGVRAPYGVVQLSATPPRGLEESDASATPRNVRSTFGISAMDRQQPRIAAILEASKPARLETVAVRGRDEAPKREAFSARAVDEALQLVEEGCSSVAVVMNRVDSARRVWSTLQRLGRSDLDAVLITGRMRPLDQADTIARIESRVIAGRSPGSNDRPLITVATQCIEAGADYDFDGLVTEAASLDALRQRFGRLDRRGHRRGRSVILARTDELKVADDPVYGKALARTWNWLESIASEGVVDFGINALQAHLDALSQAGLSHLTPEPRPAPVLMPAYLDQWAQTRPQPHADPDVALFLHGIPVDARAALADVQVVWRADVAESDLQDKAEDLVQRLAMVPPGSIEAVSLPIHTVKRWLSDKADTTVEDVLTDAEGTPAHEPGPAPSRAVLIWRGASESRIARASDIVPGDMIVVPGSYGGLGAHGTFDPAATGPAIAAGSAAGTLGTDEPRYDLGDITQLVQRGRPTLRLDPRVIGPVAGETFEALLPDEDDESADRREALHDTLTEIVRCAAEAPAWFHKILKALHSPRFVGSKHRWVAVGPLQTASADAFLEFASGNADEEESFLGRPNPESLAVHLDNVSRLVEEFAASLRLSHEIVRSLVWAARLHDIGKIDPRFQIWLYGGDEVAARFGVPLAKSRVPVQDRVTIEAARRLAAYPSGQRHELVSLGMVEGSEDLCRVVKDDGADWQLVLHLIASHHGWCRPLAPAVLISEDDADAVAFDCDGMQLTGTTAHRYSSLGSGIADRFWSLIRKYGWHELAWLEAVLQLADHRQSAQHAAAPMKTHATAETEGRA